MLAFSKPRTDSSGTPRNWLLVRTQPISNHNSDTATHLTNHNSDTATHFTNHNSDTAIHPANHNSDTPTYSANHNSDTATYSANHNSDTATYSANHNSDTAKYSANHNSDTAITFKIVPKSVSSKPFVSLSVTQMLFDGHEPSNEEAEEWLRVTKILFVGEI